MRCRFGRGPHRRVRYRAPARTDLAVATLEHGAVRIAILPTTEHPPSGATYSATTVRAALTRCRRLKPREPSSDRAAADHRKSPDGSRLAVLEPGDRQVASQPPGCILRQELAQRGNINRPIAARKRWTSSSLAHSLFSGTDVTRREECAARTRARTACAFLRRKPPPLPCRWGQARDSGRPRSTPEASTRA